MKKPTGWVYCTEAEPATPGLYEVSRGMEGCKEYVEWLRWEGGRWSEHDGQFYAVDVYAWRCKPEPAPRRDEQAEKKKALACIKSIHVAGNYRGQQAPRRVKDA
jgi:hypothetical protein